MIHDPRKDALKRACIKSIGPVPSQNDCSQLAQLIKSIGRFGKIDDFTIKPLQQHSFVVTGFSQHTSSQLSSSSTILSTAAEADPIPDDAPLTILQHGRAVDTRTVTQRRSEPSSHDDSGLSDSDPDFSSDDDGCPWGPIDEQRLLAYRKDDNPHRTQLVVRTR